MVKARQTLLFGSISKISNLANIVRAIDPTAVITKDPFARDCTVVIFKPAYVFQTPVKGYSATVRITRATKAPRGNSRGYRVEYYSPMMREYVSITARNPTELTNVLKEIYREITHAPSKRVRTAGEYHLTAEKLHITLSDGRIEFYPLLSEDPFIPVGERLIPASSYSYTWADGVLMTFAGKHRIQVEYTGEADLTRVIKLLKLAQRQGLQGIADVTSTGARIQLTVEHPYYNQESLKYSAFIDLENNENSVFYFDGTDIIKKSFNSPEEAIDFLGHLKASIEPEFFKGDWLKLIAYGSRYTHNLVAELEKRGVPLKRDHNSTGLRWVAEYNDKLITVNFMPHRDTMDFVPPRTTVTIIGREPKQISVVFAGYSLYPEAIAYTGSEKKTAEEVIEALL